MASTKKEEVEAKQAVSNVVKTEKNVEEIKAKKAAEKAKKHAERVEKHPKLGKAINWIDDHKWQVAAGAATGGVSFAAGWFGHKFFDKKKTEEAAAEAVDITPESESTEPPFEA
jgi:hypothetical protein